MSGEYIEVPNHQGRGKAVPTLGFRKQSLAIEALYVQGEDYNSIQEQTGAQMNTIYRVVGEYRKAHRIPKPAVEAVIRHEAIWSASNDTKRIAFHARAVKAAREALRK